MSENLVEKYKKDKAKHLKKKRKENNDYNDQKS